MQGYEQVEYADKAVPAELREDGVTNQLSAAIDRLESTVKGLALDLDPVLRTEMDKDPEAARMNVVGGPTSLMRELIGRLDRVHERLTDIGSRIDL